MRVGNNILKHEGQGHANTHLKDKNDEKGTIKKEGANKKKKQNTNSNKIVVLKDDKIQLINIVV